MQQSNNDTAAGPSQRMTERNRTAIDVHLVRIQVQLLLNGQCLCGKRLVEFKQIQVANAPSGFRKRSLRRNDRA